MLKKLYLELRAHKNYIFFSYLISILTLLPLFVASWSHCSYKYHVFVFFILLFLFLSSKHYHKIFAFFIIYLNITNIIIGHVFIHWGYYDASIIPRIEVAMLSPEYEIIEYFKTYIDFRDVILVSYSLMLIFLFLKYKKVFHISFLEIKTLVPKLLIGLIALFVLYYKSPLMLEPFCLVQETIRAANHSKICNARTKYLQNHNFSSKINKKTIYDKIVVIQGESANKHHMSLYGYNIATTPFLSSLKSLKNVYIFNAIAPANQTRYSVPILHSQANIHDFYNTYVHSRSIMGIYRDYGYKTFWISNQAMGGKYDSPIASLAREATFYHFKSLNHKKEKPDEILLDYLKNIKIINHQKALYLFHLIGSHAEYNQRYTQEHSLYKNPKNIQQLYDNTIYNTDYVIKSLFKYFQKTYKDEKILIVYISDHGEVVYKSKHGHGFVPPFKDEYDVPFVIYSTIENKRLDYLIKQNKKKMFNLENLSQMIMYLNGMKNDANISYSTDIFALKPKNIFDYNKLDYYHKKE